MTLDEVLAELDRADAEGNIERRIAALRELLSLAQHVIRDANAEVDCLRELGNAYHDKGDLRQAHAHRLAAKDVATQAGRNLATPVRMRLDGDLGRSYIEVHDWIRATEHTQNALAVAKELGDLRSVGVYQVNLGLILAQTGHLAGALTMARETLAMAESIRDAYVLGLQHVNLAHILVREARLNEALDHARRALAYADGLGDMRLKTQARLAVGECFKIGQMLTGRLEYSPRAEAALRETAELAAAREDALSAANAEHSLAGLLRNVHRYGQALVHQERALLHMESFRSKLGYEDFQLSFFRSAQPMYDNAIELLLRHGDPPRSFHTAERARSRLALALAGRHRAGSPFSEEWPEEAMRQLVSALDRYGAEAVKVLEEPLAGDGDSGVIGPSGADTAGVVDWDALNVARTDSLRIFDAQQSRPQWTPRQAPTPITVEDTQELLGDDDALLSYFVTEQSTIVFTITRHTYHFQHLAYPRWRAERDTWELTETIRRIADTLDEDDIAEHLARRIQLDEPWPESMAHRLRDLHTQLERLYAVLIAPALAAVHDKKHWVVVPHGPLHRLSWAALRRNDRYLIEDRSISLLPSASLGAVLGRNDGSGEPAGPALFLANPDQGGSLALPASAAEIAGAERCFPARNTFVGSTATTEAFVRHAPTAGLIHLACHHFFDTTAPPLSFFKLAGQHGSSFLFAFQVDDLRLSADLVALSACRTGESTVLTGDEQLGMVRAFLGAGARSVLAALWPVDDTASERFFSSFYELACDHSVADALARAQRMLINDPQFSLPIFWSSYILAGRWDTMIIGGHAR